MKLARTDINAWEQPVAQKAPFQTGLRLLQAESKLHWRCVPIHGPERLTTSPKRLGYVRRHTGRLPLPSAGWLEPC
jgi:hypothetical protein